MDDAPRVHAETRAQWRTWLAAHHGTAESAWLVSWKKATGKPAISYDDAVLEALAVGWVDSRPRKLDDERTMLYFSPRKPASAWSRPNKIRIETLREAGLMFPAGERAVEAAVANGAWTVLDEVEDLIVPEDLSAAFAEYAGSESNWTKFPPSARRGILEWIVTAKRAETRAARVQETARLASIGERAARWQPKRVVDDDNNGR
ncbi:YdeI/OmpD-associated family protein [Rhodococcoides yunnanense]|uniref:YdeI/OmpD-associated family protein n=1 Tax=Rhodococcoides yunnanense TaxID=278209 RepID=A0ABU4B7W4_9NOCA|nr:YdeI/OmpD-associated family protein [Rhodococcus yunnanensis]MDV6260286.1 YdeI/OmpD-associated family protein [Rhodococcus yunnanensis]